MRTDISQYLYHWVKADTEELAIEILCKIIESRQLLGGDGFIKGKHKCVCFTETPMNQFHREEYRYKKFGVRFEKNYIFSRGGRPVIYQPKCDYELLPNSLKWRHVTFDPPKIDFTWEREWRIESERLEIAPEEVTFIVPHEGYGQCLSTTYYSKEYREVVYAVPEDEPSSHLLPKNYKFMVI